jgi:hypothetical protein
VKLLDSTQDACPVCHAPVLKARHRRTLRPALLNAEPSTDGTCRVYPPVTDGAMPTYVELVTRERFGATGLRRLHAKECGPRARQRGRQAA